MQEIIQKLEEYKKLTIEIGNLVDKDENEMNLKIEKRQSIIDSIEDREKAQQIYMQIGIDKLDFEIRDKINKSLESVRRELSEYRKNKSVNSTYYRNKVEKINIFSKKV